MFFSGDRVADLPTCLLCVCLTGSVYCEEVSPDMTAVPTLPKETAYLYARFNKIKKISTKDFADIRKSKNHVHHNVLAAQPILSTVLLLNQKCVANASSDSLSCL